MSKIYKSTKKVSNDLKNYILRRKRRNNYVSCRQLSEEINKKFKIKISKSSINVIFKAANLNGPVGRCVNRVFRPDVETAGAGYAFLFGASIMLGVAQIISNSLKRSYPLLHLKQSTIEAITEAWIMAKAIYNVPLDKIGDYTKNELWSVVGRKVSKGLLKGYIDALNASQVFKSQVLSELIHCLQDVHYLRFTLVDNSQYILDGQLKSIWQESKIPFEFSTTIDRANSYINNCFFNTEPVIVFNSRPDRVLGEEVANFIFSIDGSSPAKRIRKIEMVSPNTNVIKEIPFIIPDKRRFIFGVWPWQYKYIAELEKSVAFGKVCFEQLSSDVYFIADKIKFVQHAQNIDVMLRLILLKRAKDGPATIALLSNIDENEWDTRRVVEKYLERWPYLAEDYDLFLNSLKNYSFFDDFLSAEKILNFTKKITDSTNLDDFFSIIVEVLNEFAKRMFFPKECSKWSLLKMRELFYKRDGQIKMDLSEDVYYKLFNSNMLEHENFIKYAAIKFNESGISDFSGRKLWILPQFS